MGWSWFKFNNVGLALGTNLKFCNQCGKRVKTKSGNILGTNSYVCRSYRGKTGKGYLFALNRNKLAEAIKYLDSANSYFDLQY